MASGDCGGVGLMRRSVATPARRSARLPARDPGAAPGAELAEVRLETRACAAPRRRCDVCDIRASYRVRGPG